MASGSTSAGIRTMTRIKGGYLPCGRFTAGREVRRSPAEPPVYTFLTEMRASVQQPAECVLSSKWSGGTQPHVQRNAEGAMRDV